MMIKTPPPPELIVPGIIPEPYREIVAEVFTAVKHCSSVREAKGIKFPGKKPGSLSVCADKEGIIFFERPQNVFARIAFNQTNL